MNTSLLPLCHLCYVMALAIGIGPFQVTFCLCVKTKSSCKTIHTKMCSPKGYFSLKQTHFLMKDSAQGLVLKQRHNLAQLHNLEMACCIYMKF